MHRHQRSLPLCFCALLLSTLELLVICFCAFARVRQYHCSTLQRCRLLSIICYLMLWRGTPQLHGVAIWCGLCFLVFPLRRVAHFPPKDASRARRTSATGQAFSASKDGRLRGLDFVPLANLQQGSPSYRNMCFIATVVNLRGLIPAIDEVLRLSALTWKDTITVLRAKWGNKYAHTDEFDGQDDAAELLGDILWDAPVYRWSCKKDYEISLVSARY